MVYSKNRVSFLGAGLFIPRLLKVSTDPAGGFWTPVQFSPTIPNITYPVSRFFSIANLGSMEVSSALDFDSS